MIPNYPNYRAVFKVVLKACLRPLFDSTQSHTNLSGLWKTWKKYYKLGAAPASARQPIKGVLQEKANRKIQERIGIHKTGQVDAGQDSEVVFWVVLRRLRRTHNK